MSLLIVRYLGTHLALSLGVTVLLNWVILFLWHGDLKAPEDDNDDPRQFEDKIVVGVLSAIENREQRRAIRSSWWKPGDLPTPVRNVFVVGRCVCPVPPIDRVDPYDCKRWDVQREDVTTDDHMHFSSSLRPRDTRNRTLAVQEPRTAHTIHFKVHHPVVVSKLGILSPTKTPRETLEVLLEDTATQVVVAKVSIDNALHPGVSFGGYLYRSIEPVLLPRGFEGHLTMSDPIVDDEVTDDDECTHDSAGGILIFRHVTYDLGHTEAFDDTMTVAISMGYTIHDAGSLMDHVEGRQKRQEEWDETVAKDMMQLQSEMSTYGDIVQVDIVDTYRNLPHKLLAFFEWVSQWCHQCHVIKSDDDALLDLPNILTSLRSLNRQTNFWWGKHNWGVMRHGKWYEPSYHSVTYPPFACGTAYLLSFDLVAWLTRNKNKLHAYQGEDVSVGIWLSAVRPVAIHDTRWQCANVCTTRHAFTRGQLSTRQLEEAWKSCRSVCQCGYND